MNIVQTRSEKNGLSNYDTLQEALDAAEEHSTIWKISFDFGNERVRLVRRNGEWVYESFMDEVRKML